MPDAISSSSSVASGAQLAAQVIQAQQTPDRTASAPATVAKTSAKSAASQAAQEGSAKEARPAKSAQVSAQSLDKAVKSLQDYIKPQEVISLQVDKSSGHSFVKIVNAQTKQLILQIPSAQVLAMARKLQEAANPQAASGVLVDQEG